MNLLKSNRQQKFIQSLKTKRYRLFALRWLIRIIKEHKILLLFVSVTLVLRFGKYGML